MNGRFGRAGRPAPPRHDRVGRALARPNREGAQPHAPPPPDLPLKRKLRCGRTRGATSRRALPMRRQDGRAGRLAPPIRKGRALARPNREGAQPHAPPPPDLPLKRKLRCGRTRGATSRRALPMRRQDGRAGRLAPPIREGRAPARPKREGAQPHAPPPPDLPLKTLKPASRDAENAEWDEKTRGAPHSVGRGVSPRRSGRVALLRDRNGRAHNLTRRSRRICH